MGKGQLSLSEELIAEIQGLKAALAGTVGIIELLAGPGSNAKQVMYEAAHENLRQMTLSAPGLNIDGIKSRAEQTLDSLFSSIHTQFPDA